MSKTTRSEQPFVQAREQGVLYWKKKRYRASARALSKAIEMPSGKNDFKTLYYLVLVNEKLMRFDEAIKFGARALAITSASPSRLNFIREIYDELSQNYGQVKLIAAMDSNIKTGTFQLRAMSPFINKKKKKYVERLQSLYATDPIELPHTFILPHGSYNIQGLHLDLNTQTAGTELAIFLDAPIVNSEVSTGLTANSGQNQKLWWIVGGVTTTLVIGAATFFLLSESEVQPSNEFRISIRNSQ